MFLLHDWFSMKFLVKYNISLMWRQINFKHEISKEELIKRGSKVQEKIMLCERALNFDQ